MGLKGQMLYGKDGSKKRRHAAAMNSRGAEEPFEVYSTCPVQEGRKTFGQQRLRRILNPTGLEHMTFTVGIVQIIALVMRAIDAREPDVRTRCLRH